MSDEKFLKRQELRRKFAEFVRHYPLTVEDIDGEIWRDVVGYKYLYQVSNFGRVKSFQRRNTRVIKPSVDSGGYMKVALSRDGKTKNHNVHILVARAFVSNLDNKPEVNHKNGDKWNNHFENLEWVTDSEHKQHAYRTGLRTEAQGEAHRLAKLTNSEAAYCRDVYKPRDKDFGASALARKFGVCRQAIQHILKGMTYRCTQ